VNYHTLSDFRVQHHAALDDLLTQSIAVLLHRGVVTMARVAHDGTRVRGSAGESTPGGGCARHAPPVRPAGPLVRWQGAERAINPLKYAA
jgi:hypothetical protein